MWKEWVNALAWIDERGLATEKGSRGKEEVNECQRHRISAYKPTHTHKSTLQWWEIGGGKWMTYLLTKSGKSQPAAAAAWLECGKNVGDIDIERDKEGLINSQCRGFYDRTDNTECRRLTRQFAEGWKLEDLWSNWVIETRIARPVRKIDRVIKKMGNEIEIMWRKQRRK